MFTKPLLQWKSNKYYLCVYVCAEEEVGVNAGARACACARVALILQYKMHMRHIVFGLSGSTIFFDII